MLTIATNDVKAGLDELRGELSAAAARVVDSGWYILGDEVEGFERSFAEFCGVSDCVGVGNGTDALALILRAYGIQAGDEVIVPGYTAVATWMAVSMTGATPVGVDVREATYNIDPGAVQAAISDRTRAIVAVHLFGQPADMDPLAALAERHELILIEDAAQAHGARYRGRPVGGLARAASFSFYPTKNLGAIGDGGAAMTEDRQLAERVRLLRSYGWRTRSVSEILGVNTRLDELQAAFLRVKLSRLEEWNARRRGLAGRYLDGLAGVAGLRLPSVPEWAEPVWHQFVVGVDERERVRASLAEARIQTLIHYEPLPHLTPAYRELGWKPGKLPTAEALASRALSLPMYPQLGASDVDRVIEALRRALA